jgi:hypothetical protein
MSLWKDILSMIDLLCCAENYDSQHPKEFLPKLTCSSLNPVFAPSALVVQTGIL